LNGWADAVVAQLEVPTAIPTITLEVGPTIHTVNVTTPVEYGSNIDPSASGVGSASASSDSDLLGFDINRIVSVPSNDDQDMDRDDQVQHGESPADDR
jgi:hypothetical protein